MAVMCGCDIIEINRIKEAIEKQPSFKTRVFTDKEVAYCEEKGAMKYQSYAARFAAKEAVSKALGTGIAKGVQLKDIETVNNELGMPSAVLYGKALERFMEIKGKNMALSLSHSEQYAVAYAVIERAD